MVSSRLPIQSFPAWALLNSITFTAAKVQHIESKGLGVAAQCDIVSLENTTPTEILRIPRDLILSAEAIEEYAKVDQNFKQLLEVAGRQSVRGDIMLYLLTHIVLPKRDASISKSCVSTPWTEYIKFLPRNIPVPTMWPNNERHLLRGTSLQTALEAKLSVLSNEFDELREKSSALPFWNSLFWERDTALLEDWVLTDAWYRSRSLELPQAGHAMVPALDMTNHSSKPTSYFDEDHNGDVLLLKHAEAAMSSGDEITISYGNAKSAAEMLFSYGFIDKDFTDHELTLPLKALPDDPLGKAKLHIFESPPVLKLSMVDGSVRWESPFAYFMCLNEEDGLEFRLLQDKDGNRQLKLFWQGEDVTDQTEDFESLTQDHPLRQVFRLRVVSVLVERAGMQIDMIHSGMSHEEMERLGEAGLLNKEYIRSAEILREVELRVLEAAADMLQCERTNLIEEPSVMAYFGLTEDAPNEQVSQEMASNEDDDFS